MWLQTEAVAELNHEEVDHGFGDSVVEHIIEAIVHRVVGDVAATGVDNETHRRADRGLRTDCERPEP